MTQAVLDTNVLVAACFHAQSASGLLVAAAQGGHLLPLWTRATRAEAERIVGQIPPLSGTMLDGVFSAAGHVALAGDLSAWPSSLGPVDQALVALADAKGAPLVTTDEDLKVAARAGGVVVLVPRDAVRQLA